MIVFDRHRHALARASIIAVLFVTIGCGGDGPPPVSTSTEEATVKGTVRYLGKAVTKGEIRFDPSNIRRNRTASITAPIGKDGTYQVKTLVGTNVVSFNLPALAKTAPKLIYKTFNHEVPSGESTYDVELTVESH